MFEFLVNAFVLPWSKALIAFLAAFAYQQIRKRYELRKVKYETKFEFIQTFLKEDIAQKHHLVVEQAFLNYFEENLKYDEIIFLSKLQNPMSGFHSFIKAKNYVAYDPVKKTITFKDKYKSKNKLKLLKCWHFFLYFLFAMSGMFLLFYFYELLGPHGLKILSTITFTIITLLALAYLQASDIASIFFAEKLARQIEEQKGET